MFRAGRNIALGAASQSFWIFSIDGFSLCTFVNGEAMSIIHYGHKKTNIELATVSGEQN